MYVCADRGNQADSEFRTVRERRRRFLDADG